ncbi:Fic family protein [Porphyromonas sp. HMSC077F02]
MRTKAYQIRNCLKELLEAGELEYTYPDMPRHPKQKYKTKV